MSVALMYPEECFQRACPITTEKIKGTNRSAVISHLLSELTWIPDAIISSNGIFYSSPKAGAAQLDVWVRSDTFDASYLISCDLFSLWTELFKSFFWW